MVDSRVLLRRWKHCLFKIQSRFMFYKDAEYDDNGRRRDWGGAKNESMIPLFQPVLKDVLLIPSRFIIRLVTPEHQNTAIYTSSRTIWNLRCQTAVEFAEWVHHIRAIAQVKGLREPSLVEIPWGEPSPRPAAGWLGGDSIFMKNVESWLVDQSDFIGYEPKSVLSSISSVQKLVTGQQRWQAKQVKSEKAETDNWLLFDLKTPRRLSSFTYATLPTMMAPRQMSLYHTDGIKDMRSIKEAHHDKKVTWASPPGRA